MAVVDDRLRLYARAHLLRADPDADEQMVDRFVHSREFVHLIHVFDQNLDKQMARYKSDNTPEESVLEPMKFKTATPPEVPATAPASVDAALPPEPPSSPEAIAAPAGNAAAADPAAEDAVVDVVENAAAENPAAENPGITVPVAEDPAADDSLPAPAAEIAVAAIAAPAPMPPPAPAPAPALVFRLRNGRAGDAYAHALEPQLAPGRSITLCGITLPDGLGLTADLATGMLSGTPEVAGEFDIAVSYLLQYQPDAAPRQSTAKLVINPDPKKMWQNLPSDRQDKYWKPDEACASEAGAGFRMLAASKRGRSHAHVGSFRDDDFSLGALAKSGWHVAVVADGAGSARYSRRGAQIICDEAMKHLRATLDGAEGLAIDAAAEAWSEKRLDPDPLMVEAARQGLHYKLFGTVGHAAYYGVKEIVREAGANSDAGSEATIRDFASTALIAACKRYPFGTLCVAYWVGDGAIGVYSKGREVILLGDVDSGEFSGQTRFLEAAEVSQEALVKRTRFALVEAPTALILMSDGVSDPKFETDAKLARVAVWDALWDDIGQAVDLSGAAQGEEQKLLSWLDFWSPGNHDDRTIALICPIIHPLIYPHAPQEAS
ncbi:PP2C family serine/threonine-protein phosphatase [Massilia glaciei]|nr:PP2C family serine/threonine-protein phosphatase [Massilia glaciei]